MSKTAIVLGGTGLTGGFLLKKLLADPSYDRIKLFSRSTSNIKHEKIEEYVVDLFRLEENSEHFKGDVVFSSIGTTKSKTPDELLFRKIDYGITIAAAQLCKQNDIRAFIVVSAMGANPNSAIFYNKTKGEMERDVLKLQLAHCYILQPSLLGGKRVERRFGERFAQILMSLFGFLVPKDYKMIHPETIADAMMWLANHSYPEVRISSNKIKKIASND
jgi:uncharacterized protein YbjT (DUF2867 family)